MKYLEKIDKMEDLVSPGISACQGCGAELLMRRVLQVSGKDTIIAIPPGCMAGSGAIGWNDKSGLKVPVHITLLDNTASFLTGISQMYIRRGKTNTNIIALAGDGASADCGFQSLSGAAERNEKILYICYDNEGYMNTGYQRSSTTTKASITSTTPDGILYKGKSQNQKYLPLIMSMHNIEYCATASVAYQKDLIHKIEKGIKASKHGFAYLHVLTPCPTGWGFASNEMIDVARLSVLTNLFPLWEMDIDGYRFTFESKNPLPVDSFLSKLSKFRNISKEQINSIQINADNLYKKIKQLTK